MSEYNKSKCKPGIEMIRVPIRSEKYKLKI